MRRSSFVLFVYVRIVCFYLLRYSPMVGNLVSSLGWIPFEMGVRALVRTYRIRVESRAREKEKGERALNVSLDCVFDATSLALCLLFVYLRFSIFRWGVCMRKEVTRFWGNLHFV